MSTEATAPLPAAARTLEELVAEATAAYARQEAVGKAVLRALAAPGLPDTAVLRDLQVQQIDTGHHAADLRDAIDKAAMFRAIEEARALAAEPEPEPGRPRRRAAAGRAQRALRSVRGFVPAIPLGAALAAGKHSLRHAWTAHHIAMTAAGAVTAAVPVALVAASVGFGGPSAHTAQYVTSTAPNPAAIIWSAAPIATVSPAALLRSRTQARASAKLPVPLLAPPPSWAPQPSASAAQPSPSASPSLLPLPAVLSLSPSGLLDLGIAGYGTVTLTAPDGAVAWTARCPGGLVSLGALHGNLGAGQSAPITVTVIDLSAAGSSACTFWPGQQTVTFSWEVPLPSLPDPLATPSPTTTGS